MSRSILLFILATTLFSAIPPARITYILTRAYSVTILGTSNLRNWKDTVGAVTGNMVADLNEDGSVNLHSIYIKMEVCSIKSDLGTALDKKTYRALKSDANPEIVFSLDASVRVKQVDPGGQPFSVNGFLTLAGVCRPVVMEVNIFRLGQGKLLFEGSEKIDMTDYGVKPPTALLGTIKARPQITILFKTNFINKENEL